MLNNESVQSDNKDETITETKKESNSLGVAALTLGIIGMCFSFIPYINCLSIILGFLAFIFGAVGIFVNHKKGPAIAGFILSLCSICIAIWVMSNMPRKENSNTTNTTDNTTTSVSQQNNIVNIGDVIKGKDVEVSVESAQFAQDVLPPNKGIYYTHYQVDDSSNTYLYVILNCKNISTIDIDADSVASIKVKYKDSYTYKSFSAVPDDSLGFTYSSITNIKPLTSQKIYYLAEMPKSIADETDTPVTIEIEVDNKTYTCKYR